MPSWTPYKVVPKQGLCSKQQNEQVSMGKKIIVPAKGQESIDLLEEAQKGAPHEGGNIG